MQTYFTISVGGQKAVNLGYSFCKGACYRGIYTHGKRLGQLEVVIDEPGDYNGRPNKWVDVSYIASPTDVEKTLKALRKLGFSGCDCFITKSTEKDDFTVEDEEGDFFML